MEYFFDLRMVLPYQQTCRKKKQAWVLAII